MPPSDQPVGEGVRGGRRPRGYAELEEDVAHVTVDRLLAQEQLPGDRPCSSSPLRRAPGPRARARSAHRDAVRALRRDRSRQPREVGLGTQLPKTFRAASSSRQAPSSSPSARQARPMTTRTRAARYGAPSRCQMASAGRSASSARVASPLARSTAPRACAAIATSTSESNRSTIRSSSVLASSAKPTSPAAEGDLHHRREQPRPRQWLTRRGERAPDGAQRSVGLRPGPAGAATSRAVARGRGGGPPGTALRVVELTAEPVHLRRLVVRRGRRERVRRLPRLARRPAAPPRARRPTAPFISITSTRCTCTRR